MRIPKKVTRTLAAALTVGAGLSIAACFPGNQAGGIVAQVGDSITALSTNAINNDFVGNYQVNINGFPGYTIGQQGAEVNAALTNANGTPDVLIIEAGTNDVYQGATNDPNWGLDLFFMGLDVVNTPCVIFFNVSTLVDAQWPGTGTTAEDINSAISTMVSQHSNFHLLDWNADTLAGNNAQTYLYQNAPYLGTNIHPNPAGQQWMADLELAAVQQYCPSAAAS